MQYRKFNCVILLCFTRTLTTFHILGGQAKTLMFVQLNPDVDSYSETISTLKFAERVSGIELGAARSNKEGRDIRELMQQVVGFSNLSILIQLVFMSSFLNFLPD